MDESYIVEKLWQVHSTSLYTWLLRRGQSEEGLESTGWLCTAVDSLHVGQSGRSTCAAKQAVSSLGCLWVQDVRYSKSL